MFLRINTVLYYISSYLVFTISGIYRKAVLGIRDIMVRIRISESVPLTNGFDLFLHSLILRMQKNIFFIFFLTSCQHFSLQALFQSAQHIYEKREPLTNGFGSGSGIPNTRGSRSGIGSGSPTLPERVPYSIECSTKKFSIYPF
jgi:hypothetical protein